ncbi:MAG: PEP-CTERM sorting domain-containing protein, partial [Phycisphaeraceae bacterium]|nr:PEP-CTERM sorting domain-containing protein [Phycisphaeraceae bacterium]
TITPDAGVTLDFDDVVWDKGFFGAGLDDGAIRTSLDGFAATVATGVDDDALITFDLTGLPDVTSEIEFRFYFTNDGSASSWGDINGTGLTFNGTVVPEPGSLALIALGGISMLRRRR